MPTYIDTIIADDARQELGSKVSLYGILGEEMYLAQIPTSLPSFAILQRWRISEAEFNAGIQQVSFSLEAPDGQVVNFPQAGAPTLQKGAYVTVMTFILKFMMFPIRVKGAYKFRTVINGAEKVYTFYVLPTSDMPAPQQKKVGFTG
jgi:hypothetical protein